MRWRRHRKYLKKRTHCTRCTRRNRTKLVRASVFFSSSFLLDTHTALNAIVQSSYAAIENGKTMKLYTNNL